jgi:alanine racemase
VLLVLDTIKALQDMAAYHRRQLQAPILGITGSNGKTIVKEWLYECLSEDYIIGRSPRALTPRSVFLYLSGK